MIDIQQNSPIELLQNLGFWQSGEKISQISVPGESNMNLVLRIETNRGSYILKQAKTYGNIHKFQLRSTVLRLNTNF